MGACVFSDLVVIKGDARDAFYEAVEEANDYNGHQEGYSGDIQTVSGYRMVKDFPRYGTKKFQEWEDKMLDGMGKRDCVCIELTGTALQKVKPRRFKGKRGVRAFYFFGWGAD